MMPQRNDRIGKIEIIERLGEGSMGEVFLARDTIIGREVAIKVIRRVSLPAPDGVERFMRETQAAGRLNHPNLVTIHEFGEKGGVLFQVMDYVPGEDLATVCQDPLFPAKEALGLLAQVCDGLAYAHQRGILHRNLKPSNIRIGRTSGRPTPKILDIGMTRAAGNDPAGTAAHLATLAYAAPESLQPGKLDARSDLFSVGVLAYQILTGRCPFEGDTPDAIAQRILHEEPEPLDLERFPELSPSIQGILNQALAKDPARRPASAEALAEALRAVRDPSWTPDLTSPLLVKGATTLSLPTHRPTTVRPARSHAFLAWSSGLITIAVLGGAGYWLRERHRLVRPADAPAAEAPKAAPAVTATLPAPPPAPPAAPATPPPAAAVPPPAATVPPPAAAPAPAKPQTGSTPSHYASLDEVEAGLPKDPQGAFAFLDPLVTSEPGNERATALRIVALYGLARYSECGKAIHDAREAGHPLWAMALRQPVLLKMLKQDALAPKIPRKKAPAPAQPTTPVPAP
jgi:serine/threonine-protein kinase